MQKRKPIEKDTQRVYKLENIDKIFLKKIENLKEGEQKLMLKLYKEILKDIKQ
jgi:hypothetical protein